MKKNWALICSLGIFLALNVSASFADSCTDEANRFIGNLTLPKKDAINCVDRVIKLGDACMALCKSPPCAPKDAGTCSAACKGQYDITKRCNLTAVTPKELQDSKAVF